jgi:hypothetical protein
MQNVYLPILNRSRADAVPDAADRANMALVLAVAVALRCFAIFSLIATYRMLSISI